MNIKDFGCDIGLGITEHGLPPCAVFFRGEAISIQALIG